MSTPTPLRLVGRFGRLVSCALLVTLIGTATAIGFAYLEQENAGQQRSAASAAERLARRVAEADAAEWQAIARGGREPLQNVVKSRAAIAAAVHRVRADGLRDDPALYGSYADYASALAVETRLLTDRRLDQARRTDRARVDPAHVALRAAVDRTARAQDRRADATSANAGRITWIAAALGTATLLLFLAQMLTQRRLLRREREHLEELRGLDRLKDDFIASVSHELRTPLTSIRGYLELVLEGEAGELNPRQREFLAIVDRNSTRLLRLVSDLLDVAQIESGRLALDTAEEELTGFVAEAVEAARPIAADRGISLSLQANGDTRVRVDRTRLAQVLDNLLSNALKFTDSGGSVDVRVAVPNGVALVEVADTGMGMSGDEQAKLFGRFYRTTAAGEQAIPGTGLGLWISKAIVEAHGGAIAVESHVGRGTTFRVELPTAKEHG